jgi:hypothetical protein
MMRKMMNGQEARSAILKVEQFSTAIVMRVEDRFRSGVSHLR